MLECVINISEGRDLAVIERIAAAAGGSLLDLHTDPHHHRSVLTLVGEESARAVAIETVRLLDLRSHAGAHPRIGVLDVVPFVPLGDTSLPEAIAARDRFCAWAGEELDLPCFAYGPERTLPEVRRHAFGDLDPTCGPAHAHPTAGGAAVGARPVLVAYNVWLAEPDLGLARRVAGSIRRPGLRTLGLQVGARAQVSMNLVDPDAVGPDTATDAVAGHAEVAGCELVGLLPRSVLHRVPETRWTELDLSEDKTIESRLSAT